MKNMHISGKNKLCLFMLSFQNFNMQSKGEYLVHIQAFVNNEKCSIKRMSNKKLSQQQKQAQKYQSFTEPVKITYQNEKIEFNDIIVIQTPVYKHAENTNIIIHFNLLKTNMPNQDNTHHFCLNVTSSTMIIKYSLNSICEYYQCLFKHPYLSSLNFIMLSQPIKAMIQCHNYKNAQQKQIFQLKRQIKKYRYNNYILYNKLKSYISNKIEYTFTLPRLFIVGGEQMFQQATSQQNLLKYLLNYQYIQLTLQKINYELISICQKNQDIFKTCVENYKNGSFLKQKFKKDHLNKKVQKFKLFISEVEYKFKYCQDYIKIMRQKLKIIKKQIIIGNYQQNYNNVVFQIGKHTLSNPKEISYPFIIHQVEKRQIKEINQEQSDSQQSNSNNNFRYIFIMAHGYQGSPNDFVILANFIKYTFKKSKYLVLHSYQNKMDKSLSQMADLALKEVNKYLEGIKFDDKTYKIVMIGHSMGGLILRSICNSISKANLLYGYVSLGTPHLGYLQGIKFIIRAGINFFSNLYDIPCFNELNGKDTSNLHDSCLYKLSQSGTLSNFNKIILVSSIHDKYASWHSARLQNYNKDLLKKTNFIQSQMISNIMPRQSKIKSIHRIQVEFKLTQSSLDKMIGRASHIKFLCDPYFIEMFINQCLSNVLEG